MGRLSWVILWALAVSISGPHKREAGRPKMAEGCVTMEGEPKSRCWELRHAAAAGAGKEQSLFWSQGTSLPNSSVLVP